MKGPLTVSELRLPLIAGAGKGWHSILDDEGESVCEVHQRHGETTEDHRGRADDVCLMLNESDEGERIMGLEQAEMYTCLAVSTAHIRKEDSEVLKEHAGYRSMIMERDTGFFIKLYEDVEDSLYDSYSLSLNTLIRDAHLQGFRILELDRDASVIDGYKTYEW